MGHLCPTGPSRSYKPVPEDVYQDLLRQKLGNLNHVKVSMNNVYFLNKLRKVQEALVK